MSGVPIRVLIADDNADVRAGLAALIDREAGFELAGTAGDALEAVDLAERHQPDVALLDVRMPAGGGVEAARGIARGSPQTRVVLLSASGVAPGELDVEIAGCIAKGTPIPSIVETLKLAAARS